MQYGYVRVSTDPQETALQLDAFAKAGITELHREKQSARKHRPVLEGLIKQLVAGDELIVWKVDRIARSIRELSNLIELTREIGAAFCSLTEPFDTRTPAGRMMAQMLGVFAEFEWHMIRERSMAGMEAAARRGVHIGRPRLLSPDEEQAAYLALRTGRSLENVAREFGVHKSCVQRVRLRIDKPTSPAVARRFA